MDSFYQWAFFTTKVGHIVQERSLGEKMPHIVVIHWRNWFDGKIQELVSKKSLAFFEKRHSLDRFLYHLIIWLFLIKLRETLAPCLKLNFQSIWYIAYFIWPVVASFVANRWNTVLFAAKMSFTRCELKKMKNCVASQPCSLYRPAALPLRSQGFAYCQYSLEKIWLKYFSLLSKRLRDAVKNVLADFFR